MGDKVSVPRSVADNIGVADALPSIRRHYIPIPLVAPTGPTTTGGMFGGDSDTTGIPFFQRNLTLERLYVATFQGTTINNSSTMLVFQMHKNGVSTLFSIQINNSTTQPERWHAASSTPAITDIVAADRISARIVTRNQATRISAVLVCTERVDD